MMKDGLDNLIFVGFTVPMVTSIIRQMKHRALECKAVIPVIINDIVNYRTVNSRNLGPSLFSGILGP